MRTLIKRDLRDCACNSVKETLNALLDKEADELVNTDGYTGALKAPVRCFGNHLSEKRESLFQTR